MTEKERLLQNMAPDVPECFHSAVMNTLNAIVAEEDAAAKVIPMKTVRPMRRVALLAALLVMVLGTAAYAAYRWQLFDTLTFMTGESPKNADLLLQHSLHQETVNGVEITIREAGYDGRTLFIQYSYRVLDSTETIDLSDGIGPDSMKELKDCNVGWWIDHLWVNGKCLDMPANSGSTTVGSNVPGEIIQTDYWRLDNLDVALTGKVEISLPIGERQSSRDYTFREHPEKYNADRELLLPDKGIVTFTLDTGDTLARCITEHPNVKTVHPDVTVRVSEVTFTPLMTYITLAMEPNEESLKAFIAENGEGHYNAEGELVFPFDGTDVYGSWIRSLKLVDGEGNVLFPDHRGGNGLGSKWAEFLYPYIENLPDELYLAPLTDGQPDMTYAVKVR